LSITFFWRTATVAPTISGQPLPGAYVYNAEIQPLTVTAVSNDNSALSYQWYSAESFTAATTTAIDGATEASYTPAISNTTDGEYFYEVIVTNTNNYATTTKTATAKSSRVKISVSSVPPPEATLITVDFNNVATALTPVGTGTTAVAESDGTGFTWTSGSGTYGGSWVKFSITLPEGVNLSQYSTVTFTLQGLSGDITYKNINLMGDTSLGTGNSPNTSKQIGTGTAYYETGTKAMTFTIDKGKTGALTDTIEIGIHFPCAASSDNTNNNNIIGPTQYKVSDVKFNP